MLDIHWPTKGSIFGAVVTCTRIIRKYSTSARGGFAELSYMACMFDCSSKTRWDQKTTTEATFRYTYMHKQDGNVLPWKLKWLSVTSKGIEIKEVMGEKLTTWRCTHFVTLGVLMQLSWHLWHLHILFCNSGQKSYAMGIVNCELFEESTLFSLFCCFCFSWFLAFLLAGNFHWMLLFMFLAGIFHLKRKALLTLLDNMTCLLVCLICLRPDYSTHKCFSQIRPASLQAVLSSTSQLSSFGFPPKLREADTSGGQFTMSET